MKVVMAVPPTIPLGHQAAPRCIYAFHPYGALWVVTFISLLLMGLLWSKYKIKNLSKAGMLWYRSACLVLLSRGQPDWQTTPGS
jgi:hypothetical protein